MADAAMPRTTGDPLADQYLAWVDNTITSWMVGHAGEVIAGITSYTNDSPGNISNGCSIRNTEGRSDTITSDQTKGVVSLTPGGAVAPSAGGTGTFTVATSPGFVWAVESDQPWLTAAVAGAEVTWTAAASDVQVQRLGNLRLGGSTGTIQTFVVTQDALPAVTR